VSCEDLLECKVSVMEGEMVMDETERICLGAIWLKHSLHTLDFLPLFFNCTRFLEHWSQTMRPHILQ